MTAVSRWLDSTSTSGCQDAIGSVNPGSPTTTGVPAPRVCTTQPRTIEVDTVSSFPVRSGRRGLGRALDRHNFPEVVVQEGRDGHNFGEVVPDGWGDHGGWGGRGD